MRILYVEDNPWVREVTSEMLEHDHRQIRSCETAEAALKEFVANAYDIVITDVSLPLMSGLDLTRKLLELKPLLPIIIASGYVMKFAIENLGPNVRCIVKPFGADEIHALIGELMPLKV